MFVVMIGIPFPVPTNSASVSFPPQLIVGRVSSGSKDDTCRVSLGVLTHDEYREDRWRRKYIEHQRLSAAEPEHRQSVDRTLHELRLPRERRHRGVAPVATLISPSCHAGSNVRRNARVGPKPQVEACGGHGGRRPWAAHVGRTLGRRTRARLCGIARRGRWPAHRSVGEPIGGALLRIPSHVSATSQLPARRDISPHAPPPGGAPQAARRAEIRSVVCARLTIETIKRARQARWARRSSGGPDPLRRSAAGSRRSALLHASRTGGRRRTTRSLARTWCQRARRESCLGAARVAG